MMQFNNTIPKRANALMMVDSMMGFRDKFFQVAIPILAIMGLSEYLLQNIALVYIAVAIFILVITVVFIRRYHREVSDTHIKIKRGVGNKISESVAYEKIERVEYSSSLTSRLLGLYTAKFFTGGSEEPAVTMGYLNKSQIDTLRAEFKHEHNETTFNYQSKMIDAVKSAFIPICFKLFGQAMILIGVTSTLLAKGGAGEQIKARTEIFSQMKDVNKVGDGSTIWDGVLTDISKFDTVLTLIIMMYIATIIARVIFVFPKNLRTKVTATKEELTIIKGLFIQKESIIPIKDIARVKMSVCFASNASSGARVNIDTISSGKETTVIPFMDNKSINDLMDCIGYPNKPTQRIGKVDHIASIAYSVYQAKVATAISIGFFIACFWTSNAVHLALFKIACVFFLIPLVKGLIRVFNSSLYKTKAGFISISDYNIQRAIVVYPERALGSKVEKTLFVSTKTDFTVKRYNCAGEPSIIPTFNRKLVQEKLHSYSRTGVIAKLASRQ